MVAGLVLAGCALTREPAVSCRAMPLDDGRPVGVAPPVPPGAGLAERSMMAMAARQRLGPVTVNVITLSAGGQWGAYGAGFLQGWSENPATPRPGFDIVTGVSAGAIMAPVVFAGADFDDRLGFYRGIRERDVLQRRALPALVRAPSIASPGPLRRALMEGLDAALIERIAARHRQGAQLLISATNLDTTALELFDLGAMAADTATPVDARRACMTEAIMASAAVPGLLPPRHINGALYYDGGLREQLFFRAVDAARRRVAARTGREVRVNAHIVVNGALRPPERPVADRLTEYVERSVVILADEVLRDSLADAVDFAEGRPGWRLRGAVPEVDIAACGFDEPPVATFDACLTEVLFEAGRADGRRVPIDWLDADDLRTIAQAY